MSLLIAIVLVVFLPLAIIWWIDVAVEDEFFDNFKSEDAAAIASPYQEEAKPVLYGETVVVSDKWQAVDDR